MTRTTEGKWTKPREAILDKESDSLAKGKNWIDYEHDLLSTFHGDSRFIVPDAYSDDPSWGANEYPFYYYGSTLLGKTMGPRATGHFDILLLARSPVAGRARQSRLTGPIRFLVELLETWHLTQADGITLLGLEPADRLYASELFRGLVPLRGRDTKDRIAHLFRIRKTLSALFRNDDVENDWLREPHDLLGGQEPMTLLLEGSMEHLLLVKEYVEAAAGR